MLNLIPLSIDTPSELWFQMARLLQKRRRFKILSGRNGSNTIIKKKVKIAFSTPVCSLPHTNFQLYQLSYWHLIQVYETFWLPQKQFLNDLNKNRRFLFPYPLDVIIEKLSSNQPRASQKSYKFVDNDNSLPPVS